MKVIKFESKQYVVKKILKPTSAKGFSQLKVGDMIKFSMSLKSTLGASGNRLYALSVDIQMSNYVCWSNSQNMFLKNLSNFEIEEV